MPHSSSHPRKSLRSHAPISGGASASSVTTAIPCCSAIASSPGAPQPHEAQPAPNPAARAARQLSMLSSSSQTSARASHSRAAIAPRAVCLLRQLSKIRAGSGRTPWTPRISSTDAPSRAVAMYGAVDEPRDLRPDAVQLEPCLAAVLAHGLAVVAGAGGEVVGQSRRQAREALGERGAVGREGTVEHRHDEVRQVAHERARVPVALGDVGGNGGRSARVAGRPRPVRPCRAPGDLEAFAGGVAQDAVEVEHATGIRSGSAGSCGCPQAAVRCSAIAMTVRMKSPTSP